MFLSRSSFPRARKTLPSEQTWVNFLADAKGIDIGVSEEILGRALKDFANRDEVAQKAPVVAPVFGATKRSHLESAVESLATKLTAEGMAFLEEPYVPHDIVRHQ